MERLDTAQEGFTLVEVLVAMSFAAIVSLGLLKAVLLSQGFGNETLHRSLAMQLALERMEEFVAVDPATFSDAMDSDEPSVARSGFRFHRITNISINADRSRSEVPPKIRSN